MVYQHKKRIIAQNYGDNSLTSKCLYRTTHESVYTSRDPSETVSPQVAGMSSWQAVEHANVPLLRYAHD